MLQFKNKEEYTQYQYTKELRKTSNGLGLMLLVIFGLEIIISTILTVIMYSAGIDALSSVSTIPELLENGLISSLLFFVVALLYVVIKGKSFGTLFPFEKIGVKKLSMLCVIGISVSLLSNIAPELLTEVFGLVGLSNSGGSIDFTGTVPNVLLYYLTVAIMPAFTEEFAFRGVIMGSLRRYSDGLALVISAGLFALMHGNFVQIPFTFCCGLMFGFMVLKTNSLLPSIIVHFLNNGLSVTFDLLIQYQVMSANLANLCYGVIFAITGALALIFVRKFTKEDEDYFKLERADDVIPYRAKLKTVCGSPTLISFAVLMVLFAIYVMMIPYLEQWGVIQYY